MREPVLVLVLALACSAEDPRTSSSDEGVTSTSSSSSAGEASSAAITDTTDTESSADASSSTGADEPPVGPVSYPADRVHSPVTASVATRLRALAATNPTLADDVFMKVGASTDVSTSNLHCFAGDAVDLARHDELAATLAFWRAGMAAGTTPFDRESAATEAGRSAAWAITGDPSPLVVEIEAVAPRLALVHFGTNDMELGVTPLTALPGFYEAIGELLDALEDRGIVPVVVGLTRRADDPDADRFIATYNAVLRGLAQARQVPWLDAHLAIDPLPNHGLGPDGLHLVADERGACVLDRSGLAHGYNLRNAIQLELLDRMERVLVHELEAIDPSEPAIAPPAGTGIADDPFVVRTLPFADARDTSVDGTAAVDTWEGCADSDESGPELVYALESAAEVAVRIIALDRIGVDVDVHLVGATVDGPSCTARDDTALATALAPGLHHVVIDTWAGDGMAHAGPYLLVIVPCDPGDPDCAA